LNGVYTDFLYSVYRGAYRKICC